MRSNFQISHITFSSLLCLFKRNKIPEFQKYGIWNVGFIKEKNLKNKFLPKVCYLQFWQQFLQENIGWHQTSVWALFVHCLRFLRLLAESKANQAGLAANFCVFQGHWPTKNRWCWQGWNKKKVNKVKRYMRA